jgi:hypothetical protein
LSFGQSESEEDLLGDDEQGEEVPNADGALQPPASESAAHSPSMSPAPARKTFSYVDADTADPQTVCLLLVR